MNDTTKSEDKPADDGDWLGYGVYADTLWARIERALAKDLIDGELGDDPMVIGIFGEWGAGKSQLLKLIERRAKASLNEQKKKRESDAGFELTVPVWFQPWKYEHEEHLHVPMVIHVLNALKDALKHEATVVETVINTSVAVVDSGKKALPVVQKTLEIANSVYPVIQKILKSITVFGCNVDLPDEVGEWLETAADGVSDIDLKNETKVKISTVDASVKHTTDGSYFYRIHELLGALTRPHSYKHRKDLFKDAKLTLNTRINFVIFIDDLDRCLPEKAVQTLELIKTMFNVESFAFVLALDDEVIERGIAYRYKDYALGDKKEQMPITGFEYLEKIVHLPFKLPALTQSQAKKFIAHVESKIEPNESSWFPRKVISVSSVQQLARNPNEEELKPTVFDLGELTITAFDAYVPRKLTRLVELWHATVEVAKKRHSKDSRKEQLAVKRDAQIDIRIVFTMLMVQLFHPDLYRVFRRHEETFSTLYNAFDDSAKPEDTLSASMSDIDLWHWAAYRQNKDARPTELKIAMEHMAKLDDGYRYSAQQKRLPLVARLIDHRATQRHVFDALKLFAALKKQMPNLPKNFKIAQYFSLQSEFDEALTPLAESKFDSLVTESSTNQNFNLSNYSGKDAKLYQRSASKVKDAITEPLVKRNDTLNKRLDPDANLLYSSVISADLNMQKDIPNLVGVDVGSYIKSDLLGNIRNRVDDWLKEADDNRNPKDKKRRQHQLLSGMTYLSRYINPLARDAWWELVRSSTELETDKTAKTDPIIRAQWFDVRAALGRDSRFIGKYALAKRELGDAAEAPSGYVKVKNGNQYFYISRYLVTVAQYAAFRDSSEFKYFSASRAKEIRAKTPEWAEQLNNLNHPVVNVNWYEAKAYAQWLQILLEAGALGDLKVPTGYKLRLPTEAEWLKAALGGLTGKDFPWGDQVEDIDQRANVDRKVGRATTVGSYKENAFGLFDMSGNVWQWQENEYEKNGKAYALRGGSWADLIGHARCTSRDRYLPDFWNDLNGFRLVLSVAEVET